MSIESHELVKIRHQLITGDVAAGSLLEKVISDLAPSELEKLKFRAAEGLLGIELEKMAMSRRFQSSTVEIKEFISTIKELESNTNKGTSFTAEQFSKTASGETKITVKKGAFADVCYIATAVYGGNSHPNVKLLKEFRDSVLVKYRIGRVFCRFYYKVSPKLVKHFQGGIFCWLGRKCLNFVCNTIRTFRSFQFL